MNHLEKRTKKNYLSGLTLLAFSFVCSATFSQSVDPLTGRLIFSVPLGSLQANDIAIPVSVHYQGGAVRVAQGDGDCGLGWGLSAAGSISRVVRGLPDEVNFTTKKGWLNSPARQTIQSFAPAADDDLSTCADEVADWAAIDGILGAYTNDLEPDVFYINAPGISAQFIFGTDGQPQLLSYQDIKIEFANGDFTVRTNQGTVYLFSTKESITRTSNTSGFGINTDCNFYRDSNITFTSRWNLTSVTSTATGTTANFNYTNLPETFGRVYYNIDSTNYVEDRVTQPLRISTVNVKTYTATFNWQNDLLAKVTFSESTSQDKTEAQLVYQNPPNTTRAPRSTLSKILLGGNVPQVSYDFTYNPFPTAVWRNHWGMDFFGFYNGDNINDNKPELYFYGNESDGARLRMVPTPGGTPAITPGKNRSPNGSFSYYGSLSKITLPTGGYTEIEYEPNVYKDAVTGQELFGGDVRVKKLTSQGGDIAFGKTIDQINTYRSMVKQYEYKLTNNSSSGILLNPVTLGYATHAGIVQSVYNVGEEPIIMYSRVTEKVTGQGSSVYEFSIPGVFPETVNGSWKATKNRIARKAGSSCIISNVKNGFYVFPYATSTNYNFKRGFLTRLTQYSETGVLVSEKNFTAIELSKNPMVIKAVRLERLNDTFYYGVYEMLTGRTQTVATEVAKVASEINPSQWLQTTTQYGFNANNMLETTTVTMPDNSTIVTKSKYVKDFQFSNPAPTDTMAVALKNMNDNFRHGEVVEQIKRMTLAGVAGESISASVFMYRNFGGNRVLPYYQRTLPPGAAFTEAGVVSDAFVADTDYITRQTFKDYDAESRLLFEFDYKRNVVGHHYAVQPSFQVATFANARPQECIYDGFEQATSFGLTTSGSGLATDIGWTGLRSMKFTNGTDKLVSSSTNLIQKGSNNYRVSMWAQAVVGKTVTVSAKQGASTVSINLSTTQNNKWQYLEGDLTFTSITAPFSIEVSANATVVEPVMIDDVVLRPALAVVSHKTASPLTGTTSESDNRGFSVKYEYDNGKRLTKKFDRNRNLVQKNDYYQNKNLSPCQVTSFFTRPVGKLVPGAPYTFTAGASCGNALTFAWEVNGVPITGATGATLTHTFNSVGGQSVKLTVTDPVDGSSTFSDNICIDAGIEVVITNALGNVVPPGTIINCNYPHLPLTATVTSSANMSNVSWKLGYVGLDGYFYNNSGGTYATGISTIITPGDQYLVGGTLSFSGTSGDCGISPNFRDIVGVQYDASGPCQ